MDNCHICGLPGADVPDPCCGAPDCEDVYRRAHMRCLPPKRQREEQAFIDLMFVGLI